MATERHLTPVELEVLLHYYSRVGPPGHWPRGWRSAADRIAREGVLKHWRGEQTGVGESSGYQCTELGKAWCKAILRTPKPRAAGTDPRT